MMEIKRRYIGKLLAWSDNDRSIYLLSCVRWDSCLQFI